MPLHRGDCRFKKPAVLLYGADDVVPGGNPARHAGIHPHLGFRKRVACAAEGTRPTYMGTHALRDNLFPTGNIMQKIAVDAVLLETVDAVAGLMVAQDQL